MQGHPHGTLVVFHAQAWTYLCESFRAIRRTLARRSRSSHPWVGRIGFLSSTSGMGAFRVLDVRIQDTCAQVQIALLVLDLRINLFELREADWVGGSTDGGMYSMVLLEDGWCVCGELYTMDDAAIRRGIQCLRTTFNDAQNAQLTKFLGSNQWDAATRSTAQTK